MNPIQQRMLWMLVFVRLGVGIVGISLPFVLLGVGEHFGIHFAGSMSAYYHATDACWLPESEDGYIPQGSEMSKACDVSGEGPMRNWFVGNLFFIGGAMFVMRGFSRLENWLLNIAGVLAICVAMIPMDWPVRGAGPSWHFRSAVGFFVCAGLTCLLCSRTTLKYVKDGWKAFFTTAYTACAVLMLGLPGFLFLVAYKDSHFGFYLEAVSVVAFGSYWLLKTWELKISDLERRALLGEFDSSPWSRAERTLCRERP